MIEKGFINRCVERILTDISMSKAFVSSLDIYAENSLSGLYFSRWWVMRPQGHSFTKDGGQTRAQWWCGRLSWPRATNQEARRMLHQLEAEELCKKRALMAWPRLAVLQQRITTQTRWLYRKLMYHRPCHTPVQVLKACLCSIGSPPRSYDPRGCSARQGQSWRMV